MSSTKENRRHRPGLERTISRSLAEAGIGVGARLVVGVSGGPDSTALLCALSRLKNGQYDLHACIVDHGIRPQSEIDGDVSFVRGLADSLGVFFYIKKALPGECVKASRLGRRSLEEVAREFRLQRLDELCDELGADGIVLGHTRDDVVETLLMRIFQGSGPAGLSGIASRRGRLVRPMLGCSRADVLDYLERGNIGYRTDSTNSETAILRNRIRSVLVPVLDEYFPGFRAGLLSLSRKLSIINEFVERETETRLPWRKTGRGFVIEEKLFFEAPPALRAASLLYLYDKLRASGLPRRLPYSFLRKAVSALPDPGVCVLEGHGVRLTRAGGLLAWETDIVREGEKSYFIVVENSGRHEISRTDLEVEIVYGSLETVKPSEIGIRAEAERLPLVIRSKRKGDELLLAFGTKPVKELFSEWRIPVDRRWEIPLLVDGKGVVAVLGRCRGARDVVRAGAAGDGSEHDITIRCRMKGNCEQHSRQP
jgi:tRNA(Ile)-lysidine synthase